MEDTYSDTIKIVLSLQVEWELKRLAVWNSNLYRIYSKQFCVLRTHIYIFHIKEITFERKKINIPLILMFPGPLLSCGIDAGLL